MTQSLSGSGACHNAGIVVDSITGSLLDLDETYQGILDPDPSGGRGTIGNSERLQCPRAAALAVASRVREAAWARMDAPRRRAGSRADHGTTKFSHSGV